MQRTLVRNTWLLDAAVHAPGECGWAMVSPTHGSRSRYLPARALELGQLGLERVEIVLRAAIAGERVVDGRPEVVGDFVVLGLGRRRRPRRGVGEGVLQQRNDRLRLGDVSIVIERRVGR